MKIKDFVSQNGDYDAYYALPPKIRNAYHSYIRNCIGSGKSANIKKVGQWLQDYQHKGEGAGLMPLKDIAKTLKIPLPTLGHTMQRAIKHFRLIVEQNPQKYDLLTPMLHQHKKDDK